LRHAIKHDGSQRRGNPSTLRVPDHNAEDGANGVGKTSFTGSSWSSAKRRSKDKKRKESYVQTWENNATPERLWIQAYAPAKRTLSEFKNAMVLGLCHCEQFMP